MTQPEALLAEDDYPEPGLDPGGRRVEGEERHLGAFRPIRMRSASDEVLAVLIDAIRGGVYGPGDLLPRERDLAVQLGVSRTVLREAVAALRQAGIVSARRGHGGGMMVDSLSNLREVLSRIAGETRFELHTVLEVRRILEPQTALLSSQRAGAEGVRRLTELVDQLAGYAGRDQEFYEADVRFHLALGEYSGNPMLAQEIRNVFNRMAVLREPFLHAHVDFPSAIANQRDLLGAILSRDVSSIAATVDHHLAAFELVMLGHALPRTPGM
jgi:GntR family transcriptional repressor for pyruvate dehydrogenase complex